MVCSRGVSLTILEIMSEIYRVQERSNLAGVCIGLESAGKGSATAWRLVFVVGSLIAGIPVLIYPVLALAWPQVKTVKEAQIKAGIASEEGLAASQENANQKLTGVEANLSRLVDMKEKGLITEEEFSKMRKKELGLE